MEYQFNFTSPFEGYVRNYLKTNFWRVQRTHEYNDVMQEARMHFFVVQKRLKNNGSIIENDRHMMALFKTAWSNHFITLAHKSSKFQEQTFTSSIRTTEEDEEFNIEDLLGGVDCEALLEVKLNQATGEVREVLNLILNTPKEVLELAAKACGCKDVVSNKLLCKLLGKDSTKINLIKCVKKYLTE